MKTSPGCGTSLEEADKRNAEDIKALDKNLNDLKADLPLIYVTREDYIRLSPETVPKRDTETKRERCTKGGRSWNGRPRSA